MNSFSFSNINDTNRIQEIMEWWSISYNTFYKNCTSEDILLFRSQFTQGNHTRTIFRGLEFEEELDMSDDELLDYLSEDYKEFCSATTAYSIAREFAGLESYRDGTRVIVQMDYDGYFDVSDGNREDEIILYNPSYSKIIYRT